MPAIFQSLFYQKFLQLNEARKAVADASKFQSLFSQKSLQ